MSNVPKIDLSKILQGDELPTSTQVQEALTKTPRDSRRKQATQALWATSTQRAWETTLQNDSRRHSLPAPLPASKITSIVHEPGHLPDPVAYHIRAPKRYEPSAQDWQPISTKVEGSKPVYETPQTVNLTGTQRLNFRPQGQVTSYIPGYSGHISNGAREGYIGTTGDLARSQPYQPLESTHNHVNTVGYTGFVPKSLQNMEYSRHSRAIPADLTSTSRSLRHGGQGIDGTSRQYGRAASLGKEVVISWPFNPFNNKIGSAVTGTVYPSYRQTRQVHPTVGPSGI